VEPARKQAPSAHRPEEAPPTEAGVDQALRLVARREHTLLSLSELSHELTISLDLFNLADLILFNLMGHFGTARSALWLSSEASANEPVLVRCHGINRQVARALGASCASRIMTYLAQGLAPLPASGLEQVVGSSTARLIQRADISLFAAIAARGEVLGLLALGPRVSGEPFGTVEEQALQASLGMIGVTIQNMTFYNRLLENNRQLRLANQNLKSLDQLKSEFLSNVNHELRTPLTNIIAYVDCLLDQRRGADTSSDFLKVVMEEAVKLQALLENLLSFSALKQKKLALNMTTGNVVPFLAAYHQERLPGVTEGFRELVLTCGADLPDARFDERRMLEIVDALINNAVKFTPVGSRVELRVRTASEDGRTWVAVDVEDDGPGIPAERLPALFDSFHQVDGSSTRTVGGMGIGLAFAKQLAEWMGGQLKAESQIGKGSTFTLLLPTA